MKIQIITLIILLVGSCSYNPKIVNEVRKVSSLPSEACYLTKETAIRNYGHDEWYDLPIGTLIDFQGEYIVRSTGRIIGKTVKFTSYSCSVELRDGVLDEELRLYKLFVIEKNLRQQTMILNSENNYSYLLKCQRGSFISNSFQNFLKNFEKEGIKINLPCPDKKG